MFINKFKNKTDIEKAKTYYWLYGILYTIIFILGQKLQLIINSIMSGIIVVEFVIFLLLQLFVSNFRSCEVLDIDEIEKDIKNMGKDILNIMILQLVFNMSLLVPGLKEFKKYWQPGVVFMPGQLVFIFNNCINFGGMGAISRFIKRKSLQLSTST